MRRRLRHDDIITRPRLDATEYRLEDDVPRVDEHELVSRGVPVELARLVGGDKTKCERGGGRERVARGDQITALWEIECLQVHRPDGKVRRELRPLHLEWFDRCDRAR